MCVCVSTSNQYSPTPLTAPPPGLFGHHLMRLLPECHPRPQPRHGLYKDPHEKHAIFQLVAAPAGRCAVACAAQAWWKVPTRRWCDGVVAEPGARRVVGAVEGAACWVEEEGVDEEEEGEDEADGSWKNGGVLV